MLEQGEVDIAPACFAITAARSTVVDFLPPIYQAFTTLYLRDPAASLHWPAYTEPLTPLRWGGFLLFSGIVPPILAGIIFYGKC